MIVAGVDCGTNSIRLLIARAHLDSAGRLEHLEELKQTMTVVRLGQGVDRTGQFAPAAIARTLAAVTEIAGLCEQYGVEKIRFTATSASRDASNREEFIAGVRERLGVTPEVISGAEEARLTYLGAVSSLPPSPATTLVVDVGGGSSEFVLGRGPKVLAELSTDMGSVRVSERFFPGINEDAEAAGRILAGKAREAATEFIDGLIASADAAIGIDDATRLLALAGTATTLAARALNTDGYRPDLTHGHVFTSEQMRQVCEEMMAMSVAERRALPFMPPGRADVIGAGALIWERIIRRAEAAGMRHVQVSEHDILDGVAASAINA